MRAKQLMGLFLVAGSCFFSDLHAESAEDLSLVAAATASNWHACHSPLGNCSLEFPVAPSRLADKIKAKESGLDVHYDAFVTSGSTSLKNESSDAVTYMFLVTQYPEFVDDSYAKMGLESFLNGLINRSSSHELLRAQLTLVEGNEALDFLIRAGTKFFSGRAVTLKNNLYLLAMECEIPSYSANEENYQRFLSSFKLQTNPVQGKQK